MIILTHFIAFFAGAACATVAITTVSAGARADRREPQEREAQQ